MTKGANRVGMSFNPSGNAEVDEVKSTVASLIDGMQDIVDLGGEAGRCAAIAQTKFEEAAMWAVKAITKPKEKVCE